MKKKIIAAIVLGITMTSSVAFASQWFCKEHNVWHNGTNKYFCKKHNTWHQNNNSKFFCKDHNVWHEGFGCCHR